MIGRILEATPSQLSASNVFRRSLIRAIVYPVLLMLVLTGVFLWQLSSILTTNSRVRHSNFVITQGTDVFNKLVDMETGLRGYLITGNLDFLQPYQDAQETFAKDFQALKDLVIDNPNQTEDLTLLESDIALWQDFARQTLVMESGGQPVNDVTLQMEGKQQMDLIRDQMNAFIDAERELRNQRIVTTQATTQFVILSGIGAGLVVGAVLIVMIRQQLVTLSLSYRHALILSQHQTEELFNQKEWLRGVLSGIGDAVIATDIQGNITFVNEVTETLTGWSAEETQGKPLTEVYQVAMDEEETVIPAPERAAKSSASSLLPTKSKQLIARDGQSITIEDTARPIKDVHGKQIGQVIVFRDVTQRKRIEQERLRFIETQAHYAMMLKRSNENLQQFAYVASHDLQEPLRMVVSYLQLIERRYTDLLDKDGREFIGFAVDGANRMKELIQGLLAYARVDRAEQEIQQQTSLEKVVNQVLSNLSVAIADSGAEVTCDPLPQIQADSLQITQLFQNLIGNALKFRADQPLRIHIGAEQKGDEWQFSVRDNGIGIESGAQEKVFGLFQRLHRRSQYAGTGIGLAICKKVVERHQGRIWVESEVGQGSTFYFTLPTTQTASPLSAQAGA